MSASLSIRAVDKIYQRRGKPPVHAVKALTMDVGRARSSRCSARPDAARPRPCA